MLETARANSLREGEVVNTREAESITDTIVAGGIVDGTAHAFGAGVKV
jgi:hypothetical protein